ncbi:MAG TPA: TonB-dependent receptor [Burkholderiaceae bacterium]|nr:TonB-dependent receptor [Burkholderiaceae bacterium]
MHRTIVELLRKGAPALALGAAGAFGAMTVHAADAAAKSDDGSDQTLETVVISGQRAALQTAQKIKENSKEIVDSIVAEDIGKLPDRSVVEVLQRIPGVSIDHTYRDIAGHTDPEHYSVEGAGVTIRGLSYVRSELNGRDSFTANGGRSLSFDDVPPELMAAVDVYKNPTGDHIEGSVGGLVNLRTLMPFDISGSRTSLSAQEGWGDLSRGKARPQLSALYSNRWQSPIGEIGVLVDLAYSESATRSDAMELHTFYPRVSSLEPTTTWIPSGETVWLPQGVSWRTLQYTRTRQGAYGALQWRPSENVESSLTVFRSSYKFHWDESAIFEQDNVYSIAPAPGTNFTIGPNGQFISGTIVDSNASDGGIPFGNDTRSANRHSVTTDIAWNTRWKITDRLTLTSDLQHVLATTRSDDVTVATNVNLPSETISLAGSIPTVSVDQAYLANPANYYWSFTMDGASQADGKQWAWREDLDYKLEGDFFHNLHAGARYVDREALTQVTMPGGGYNWVAISQTWMQGWYESGLAYLNQYPGATRVFNFPNFFNGKVPLPSSLIFPAVSTTTSGPAGLAALQAYRAQLCGCDYTWSPATFTNDAGSSNTQNEHVYSAYLSADFGSKAGNVPFDGNVSARFVHTSDSAQGFAVVNAFDIPNPLPSGTTAGDFVAVPGSTTPISANNSYSDFLPSFNIRFHFTDKLQARLALAKAIARPDFSQLQAFTSSGSQVNNTTNVQTFTGTASGNPTLKPVKSNQADASLEWYFAPSGSLTGALFYKRLSDVIVNELFTTQLTDANGASHDVTTNGPVNGANGTIKGFEIAYQQYFDFLPSVLKGLGLQANFTHIDSTQSFYSPVTGAYCSVPAAGEANLLQNLAGCDTDGRAFGNLPLQGLSKTAYNVALLYDRGPVSARLAYGWRSKYLLGVNVNAANGSDGLDTNPNSANYGNRNLPYALPVYGDDFGQLDGSVFYKINAKLNFGIEVKNITDSIYRELRQQHFGTTPLAWYDSGRSFYAQLRLSL